jgi:hypothetical protein
MDVRLTAEQQQLRDAAAKLADDLGPGSVTDLADSARLTRLEKTVASTGWRSLRSDGASGVEVAVVAEEFGRGLVDVPFLGPALSDELGRLLGRAPSAVTDTAGDVDLTGSAAGVAETPAELAELSPENAQRWHALALATTAADILGAARGAHTLAVDYAKIRAQYGKSIGSYQAIAHLLAEGLAMIEGSVSIQRHAAWAVDELSGAEAVRAGRYAKLYCARAARTVCETSIQVHGGIGNTWECLAHVYLRRVLTSSELWPVRLEDIDLGFS